jgi:hypothetical protein
MQPASQVYLAFALNGRKPAVELQHAIQRYTTRFGRRPGLLLCRPEHQADLVQVAGGLTVQAPKTGRGNPLIPAGLFYLGDGNQQEVTPCAASS